MSANERQVGGNHYRDIAAAGQGEQHWDMMWRLYGEAWFVGCITKYVLRYKKKNGIEDLKKAQHYLEKLIELETAAERIKPETTGQCQHYWKFADETRYCVLLEGHEGCHEFVTKTTNIRLGEIDR